MDDAMKLALVQKVFDHANACRFELKVLRDGKNLRALADRLRAAAKLCEDSAETVEAGTKYPTRQE